MSKGYVGMSWPIVGYVGANGAGKTLAMVEDLVVPAMARRVPVLSNLHLDYERAVPLRSWRQLAEPASACECAAARLGRACGHLAVFNGPGVVLLDEISSVLPSRQAMTLPPQLLRILNQLRKAEVQLGWSAPAWARADLALREVTQAVCVSRGYLADRYLRKPERRRFPFTPPLLRGEDGRPQKVPGWASNRLFSVTYYDAVEMDEFSYGRVEDVKPRMHRYYWRPAHRAHLLYNTLEGVDLLDHVDDSGACLTCGGSRKRRVCACELDSPFEASSGPGDRARRGPGPRGVDVASPGDRGGRGPVGAASVGESSGRDRGERARRPGVGLDRRPVPSVAAGPGGPGGAGR